MFRVFSALLVTLSFLIQNQAHAFDRIVTLAPVLAEWTAAILGESQTKAKLVGVSEYSLYPEYLKSVPSIGPYPQLNVEKIASLKPDLVIASQEYNRPEQLDQLKRLKLPVVLLPLEQFNAMPVWINLLGRALHDEKGSAKAVAQWNQELQSLKATQKTRNQRLFIEIQHQPLVTVGGPSFITDAFAAIGYINVFRSLSQGYPKVSKEAVLKENPDAIFILDLTGVKEDFEKAKVDWQHFKTIKAVKGNQIRTIPGDDFARCSLRLLKALNELH